MDIVSKRDAFSYVETARDYEQWDDDPGAWAKDVERLAHTVVALHDRVAEQAAEIERLRVRQRELREELAALRPRSPWADPASRDLTDADLDLLP